MKTYRTKTGPFQEKPFFKPEEIDQICIQELVEQELFPTDPAPIRIDRFIEKRFRIQPRYEDLPEGVLGGTIFGKNGVEEIIIARSLDREGTRPAERRLRTTLAHESGHGLLHAHLFVLSAQSGSLLDNGRESEKPKILCREENILSAKVSSQNKSPYRWWEFQANLAMGALLLPKSLVKTALSPLLTARGLLEIKYLEASHRQEAIRLLAETFDVNPIVAKIRLERLFPMAEEYQLTI